MSYQKTWVPSPNFTPGNQTQQAYGRPRTIDIFAGHWWNYPRAGAQHDGVVSMFQNAARQVASHAVLSARRVTEMVRPWDTAWCTGRANPYSYAIEVDPRIMFRWGHDNPSAAERALGNEIFETLAEYLADMGYHNLPGKPHKELDNSTGTVCNPIVYAEVMARAKEYWNAKNAPTPKPPAQANIEYREFAEGVRKFIANKQPTKFWDFNQTSWAGFSRPVKEFSQGAEIDIKGYAVNSTLGSTYLLTPYSFDKRIPNGFNQADLDLYTAPKPEPVVAEWLRNLKDIAPIKLMVIPAQTAIVNLATGQVIKQLGQGTWVDFTKATSVNGKEYLISSYAATNGIPNGIAKADVAVPAAPPANEKPKWLQNWLDIEDVIMYTRVDANLVDLNSGNTIKRIPRGTRMEIASATFYLEQKYLLTNYSTIKSLGQGILVDDLDFKDPNATPDPVPAPEQPPVKPIEERVSNLEGLFATIKTMLAAIMAKLGISEPKEVTPMGQPYDNPNTVSEIKEVDPTAPTPPAVKGVRTGYQAIGGVLVAFLYGLWELPGVPEYVSNFIQTQGVSLLLPLMVMVGLPSGVIAWLQNRAGK